MISYGVGVPLFLLADSNKNLLNKIHSYEYFPWVAFFFFLAVFAQIILALLDKSSNWFSYDKVRRERSDTQIQNPGLVRRSLIYIVDKYWIDFGFDITTLLCFMVSTLWAIYALH